MMVFINNRKLHVSVYSGHHKVFDNFFAVSVIYNTHKPCVDIDISSSLLIACVC